MSSQTASEHPSRSDDLSLVVTPDRRIFEQVYARLRKAIVTGFLEPGSRMVERELTERLRVSRTPIREALRKLEQDEFVICYPHRGYYVRKPTYQEALEAYEVRRGIEGLAGELGATRATAQELEALRAAVREGRDALASGDRLSVLLYNNDLHLQIVRTAHNAILERQFNMVWAYVDLLRGRWWTRTDRPDVGHEEHVAIVDALAARDPALARRLNEEHVTRAWKNISRRFSEPDHEILPAPGSEGPAPMDVV